MRFLLLIAVLATAGCASVPMSTMAKLGGYNKNDLASVEPQDIRVRVQVPSDFVVDPDQTMLTLSLTTTGAEITRSFPLQYVGEDVVTISDGLFTPDLEVRRQTLKLSDDGIRLFQDIQKTLLSEPLHGFKFNVTWKFSKKPDNARSVRLWIDLQLDPRQGLFPLFKDTKLSFSDTEHK